MAIDPLQVWASLQSLSVRNLASAKQVKPLIRSTLGLFPFVRTGRPDHYRTSQLANELGFFPGVFPEKPSPSCILFRIGLIWLNSFD